MQKKKEKKSNSLCSSVCDCHGGWMAAQSRRRSDGLDAAGFLAIRRSVRSFRILAGCCSRLLPEVLSVPASEPGAC